ncbi:MAG: HAD-IA family hydrolase [Candidatus Woesebacteria bacterium]|nr:HAD-IA family hydrolase [Candidatus Woesebacteria bacterium]
MLTKDELDFLNKIPADKKVNFHSFDPKVVRMAEDLIQSISNIFPDLEVKHMGASALGISGQNDIDIYAFSEPKDFEKFLPGLVKLFEKPLHRHETFIEWKFKREEFDVEFYLTTKDSKTMKKQLMVFQTLKNNKDLLKEYEKLKESMNEKSFREYQEKKYEFYHRILDNKIKAIIFDLVGVLVLKKEGFIATSPDEINAQNIEKEKLNLSDGEIKKALPYIPTKFERFEKLWEILSDLKKQYKLAVINNGNSIALRYWKEKFDFGIFNLYINSGEIGLRKPDPKIYLLTCKKLDVKPEECLFMDDSLENIEAAKKLGMKTIWWNKGENKEKLLTEFKKLVNS